MKRKYFTKEEQKQARKIWNKKHYEKKKQMLKLAKQIIEREKKELENKLESLKL